MTIFSMTVSFILNKFPFVIISICMIKNSLSMSKSIAPISNIWCTIWPCFCPLTVFNKYFFSCLVICYRYHVSSISWSISKFLIFFFNNFINVNRFKLWLLRKLHLTELISINKFCKVFFLLNNRYFFTVCCLLLILLRATDTHFLLSIYYSKIQS